MQYLYIDESGSMTSKHANTSPYFIISIVRAHNPQKLRILHKRFVRQHFTELRAADSEKRMFDAAGNFVEFKGSGLTSTLKRDFVSFFCRENTLDIFYVLVKNKELTGDLFSNTARTFNYVLKRALENLYEQGYLPDDQYSIQLDERNERMDARHFLQNYLNTEFRCSNLLSSDLSVHYFDSASNKNIQIADVLANLYYSELRTAAYSNEFKQMFDNGCLKYIFQFPPK